MIIQHTEYMTNLFLNKYWRFLSFYYYCFMKDALYVGKITWIRKERGLLIKLIEYVDTINDQIQFKVVKGFIYPSSIFVSNGNILISIQLSLTIHIYQSHTYHFHVCCRVTTFNAHKWVFEQLTRPRKSTHSQSHTRI